MNIKERREALGLSQNELARRSGVTQATISDIENEKTTQPWIGTLIRIAKVLDCTVEDLISEKGEKTA